VINVVAACKHAAFSEVFSSLVTRRDLLVVAPDPERGLILHRLVMQDEDCSTIYHWEELIPDRRRGTGLTPSGAARERELVGAMRNRADPVVATRGAGSKRRGHSGQGSPN